MPEHEYTRHSGLLDSRRTLLLVVDVQERLMPVIDNTERVTLNIRRLVQGAGVLGLPVLATEQYPKGLGLTVASVRELLDNSCLREKLTFSCLGEPAILGFLKTAARGTVLVCGAEAHVCVSQTVHDLLAAGFRVHVAADAVSSRDPENRRLALERMARAGATITSTEAALFELLERAGTEQFRAVSKLVK
ncbi:hydrolase [bacterium]|nr:hydrolase [bacterium]